ncbi:receptor-interacting serine/threonine-protein kinase 3 [Mixophyes fleayi]|uniref:receptor-interacting serine/threonine-protein kinase 3 n=1 Tax=Mixophyes fleayi TaxID=3061075 RepID=UPI003F4E0B69
MNKKKSVPLESLSDWKQIDEGHFGTVYKVRHNVLKLTVAVKKLKENVSHCLEELFSEAEKMDSASASPYVIRLYGILDDPLKGPPGIVMEYMEYGSLGTLMERVSPVPWALKFRVLHEVALGMNWLHTLSPPLLHLDLKTKNILTDKDLHIKITDFGLSKYTSGSSVCRLEECEDVGGTLDYMPPEAFQEGYQPQISTDVYSFAILSIVVLKGEEPYPANKSVLIRQLVPRGQRPSVKSLENESSVKSLNDAVKFTEKCWDNDKLKRPSFSECCNQWERFNSTYDKSEIKSAVREVQDKMDSSDKTTEDSRAEGTVSESVRSTNMSDMVEKFRTLQFTERPPVLQQTEAAPQMSPQRTQSQYTRRTFTTQANQPRAVGTTHRPMTQGPYYPGVSYQHYWPPHFLRYQFPYQRPAYNPPQYSLQPSTTTININGSTGPLQIGDNNVMYVSQNPRTITRMITPQPGQTMTRNNIAPTRTQSMQITQPQPTMQAREDSLG